ncbi:MAG: hypothetical protein N2712_06035 [Brevinematales bacterium]|nr:hypothetical protein [Brevinematales bacterium]
MIKNTLYNIIEYFTNPQETINNISEDRVEIEKLGVIGIVFSFFALVFQSSNRIDTSILAGTIFILLALIYTVFIIGFSLSIGKKPLIDTPKVFWFLFSVGIIDLAIIIIFPLSFIANWILGIVALGVFIFKLYYLIVGISRIFQIAKSTAILILLSPYIIIAVILILILVSSYITISGAIQDVVSM